MPQQRPGVSNPSHIPRYAPQKGGQGGGRAPKRQPTNTPNAPTTPGAALPDVGAATTAGSSGGATPPAPANQPTDQPGVQLDQQNVAVEAPPDAAQRIEQLRADKLFSSDLSVSEFLLAREAGFEPLGVVIGSSVYHIGWQPQYMTVGSNYGYGFGYGYTYDDQELTVLTEAKLRARELAMSRMEAEATALGADGIIGVRLDVGEYAWGPGLAEFIAIGTAVRARGSAAGSYRTRFGKPFTSDLSGQDFRTLLHAGYRPLALVLGVCVFAAYQNGWAFQQMSGWWGYGGVNQEVTQFTQATYSARELAMGRMQTEAANLGATGVVGMRYEMDTRLSRSDGEFRDEINETNAGAPANHWRSFVADLFAVGTAIAPLGADHEIPRPSLVLPLDG
ncbi:MAG TPA: heavy metal-binding domain-containing protein [Ktedonobacterales bacterium]|nr:heavy metal-binding domain-containing protein [Ktedonobacterales bacterium]